MTNDEKMEGTNSGCGNNLPLPSVAVVIPVYNGEKFIEATIRSAAAQDYKPLNIIAVDDGSTDKSLEILEKLKTSVPNLAVYPLENGGVARARNRGTELADTDYVAYLDQDDLWHSSKIKKQIHALLTHSDDSTWAACYTANRIIDDQDRLLRTGTAFPASGFFFGSHLVMNHVGNGSNFLVRRSAALEVGGFNSTYFDEGIGGLEDRDFQLRILQRFKAEYVPECLVGYRMHSGTMSSSYEPLAHGVLAVTENYSNDVRVPSTLRRVAMSAAHRYAALRFFLAGKYHLAIKHFIVQLWLDPIFGPPASLRKTYYRSYDRLNYKLWKNRGRKLGTRTFSSMEPKELLPQMNARRPKLLERWLANMDRKIEAATQDHMSISGTQAAEGKGQYAR
ncbi:MAG: glycosyltransferase family A protein [Roseobacter sp.]